ncbi:MAG TPA: peptide chain release factor N(5)-glutamine methyltransferase [Hyphomicrobium sp.]|nr:peptide chain release factor N(5)-glutamine methyltransferase [Hyphomicrobium sp.]
MEPETPSASGGIRGLVLAGLETREAIALVMRELAAAGIDGPGRDARLLLLGALNITGTDLLRAPERRLSEDEAERLGGFIRRRIAREPVSRILGERGFYGRTFRVTPATLDPRPCTETVVEAALEIAEREGWRERPIRILDVGTGSGALLVTLLAELPLATGVGTDISDAALEAARENAERLGVGARAVFLNRRSLDGVEGPFDMLVSNPPYIPSGDIAGLEPEVREFDPAGALDGGADGLDIYRELAAGLPHLVPAGWALLEVGAGQAKDVESAFRAAGGAAVAQVRTWMDLGQHERCVAVQTQH